jgi:hypothetical protein
MLFGKTSQWKLALDIGAVKARAFAFQHSLPYIKERQFDCTFGGWYFLSTDNTIEAVRQACGDRYPMVMILPRQQSGSQPFKCVLEGSSTVSTMTLVL